MEKRTREILVRVGGDEKNYLDCAHGCHQLAWEEAIDNVLDILTSGGSTCGPLSANELQRAAEYLSTVNALPLKKILDMIQLGKAVSCVVERAITKQLIHWFPLLSVCRSTNSHCSGQPS